MIRNLVLFCAVLCAVSSALADPAYQDELIAKARRLGLAQHAEWHALMHYHPRNLGPGVVSEVDGRQFFNAPDGKVNPAAELDATLTRFFDSSEPGQGDQHPQCRFVARLQWLSATLGIDRARLPAAECRAYNSWHEAMAPVGATLVFPSAYLNNPASMFGHTFLRIDGRGQDERSRLLAYSVSYAADTDERNGVVFALKGIFGGYPGLFSVLPYYMKVKEYSDLENRDIWEYRLTLAPNEVDQLLRHVWELRQTYFDYYFFDENCAYHLLSLLEVARPGLQLTQQFPLWAVPAETVRAVTMAPNLVAEVTYRPASNTLLRYRLSQLSATDRAQVLDLGDGASFSAPDGISPERQARILELGYDVLEYRKSSISIGDAQLSAQQLDLLRARSRVHTDIPPAVVPPPPRPEQGHRSTRMSLGWGSENHHGYTELGFRPAYHDLLDPEKGFTRGSQLTFAGAALRYREKTNSLAIEDFTLLGMQSLAPRDQLFKPVSWRLSAGLSRKYRNETDDFLVARVGGGPGIASRPHDSLLLYGLGEAQVELGSKLDLHYALAAGARVGAKFEATPRWTLQLVAVGRRYFAGDRHSVTQLAVQQRITLGPRSALRVDLSQEREYGYARRLMSVAWQYFF